MIAVRRNIPIIKVGSYFGLGTVERLSTTFSQFYAKYSDILVLLGLWKKSYFSIAKRRERYKRTDTTSHEHLSVRFW